MKQKRSALTADLTQNQWVCAWDYNGKKVRHKDGLVWLIKRKWVEDCISCAFGKAKIIQRGRFVWSVYETATIVPNAAVISVSIAKRDILGLRKKPHRLPAALAPDAGVLMGIRKPDFTKINLTLQLKLLLIMATDVLLREFNSLPQSLQKHVIEYISFLKKSSPLLLKKPAPKSSKKTPLARKAGWGKDIFLYVAPDFDEMPIGFDEYQPSA